MQGAPSGYFWFYAAMASIAFITLIERGLSGEGWSWATVILMICITWFAYYARPRKVKRDE